MSLILKSSVLPTLGNFSALSRSFSGTCVLGIKQWRVERGLSANSNKESVLTDGPDYTFLDGRPTPLLHKQKLRVIKQREFATKIVQLSSELNFARERHQNMIREAEEQRQAILADRLKPKGEALKKKS